MSFVFGRLNWPPGRAWAASLPEIEAAARLFVETGAEGLPRTALQDLMDAYPDRMGVPR
ncbi:MAG: phage tail assembly chaperone [Parvibaculaceae bacterium]